MKDFFSNAVEIVKLCFYVVIAYLGYMLFMKFFRESPPKITAIIEEKNIKIGGKAKETKYTNKDINDEIEKLR